MPVIKSAKKRMKQNAVRRMRNYPVRSELKTLVKKVLDLVKAGKVEEANKLMPMVYSVIDTAAKKKIIPKNTADRKKSRLARALNALVEKGGKKAEPKAESKAKTKTEADAK